MNRRGFLGMMVGGVAATAAVRTWPFRVYSFPAEVVTADFYAEASWMADFRLQYSGYLYVNNPRMQTRLMNITIPAETTKIKI